MVWATLLNCCVKPQKAVPKAEAAVIIQRAIRKQKEVKEFQALKRAATTTQARVRGHQLRNKQLLEAAKIGDIERTKNLIKHGADVDAKDNIGWTALHWVASKGNLEIVAALVKAGAEVNVTNKYGLTALQLAQHIGDEISVKNAIEEGKQKLISLYKPQVEKAVTSPIHEYGSLTEPLLQNEPENLNETQIQQAIKYIEEREEAAAVKSATPTLDNLPDDCQGGIVDMLSITGSRNFSQTTNHNLKILELTKIKQLGKFFKNAKFADSYTIKTIQAYMLEGGLTLEGHEHYIFSVIQLKDGRLVSASLDRTLKVWDLTKPEGQQCVATLEGHKFWICSVIQLKDGRLVSASRDKTLKVWDLNKPEDQQCVATLRGHEDYVMSVIQLKDGRLVSTSWDKTLKVWDLNESEGQQCVATLRGHTDTIYSVIQLKNGRVVSASGDRTLKVWDLNESEGQQCIATLRGHTGLVYSVIQLKDGRVVSASGDKTLKVWDLTKPEGQECVATLRGHTGMVYSVIQLKDGRFVSASQDKTLKVWGVPINKNTFPIKQAVS